MEQSLSEASVPQLEVRAPGSDRVLRPGPAYTIGRDLDCDIVIANLRVSRRHAVLRLESGHWVLADDGSTNGIYVGDLRVDRIEITGECLVRLGHPVVGVQLRCTLIAPERPTTIMPAQAAPTLPPGVTRLAAARTRPAPPAEPRPVPPTHIGR